MSDATRGKLLPHGRSLRSEAVAPPRQQQTTPSAYVSQPIPLRLPSKRCGSGLATSQRTRKLRKGMSPQSRSGGGGGVQTPGYEGAHLPLEGGGGGGGGGPAFDRQAKPRTGAARSHFERRLFARA